MSEADVRRAAWAASFSRLEGIRSFFAPIANLATGAVVGIEVLPRPRDAAMGEVVAATAAMDRRSALDVGAAVAGIRRAVELGCVVPLHVNLLADTVAEGPDGALSELLRGTREAGRDPSRIVVEIGAPADEPTEGDLLAGAAALRERGFRLAVDEVGLSDHALAVIARMAPNYVALHPEVVAGLDADPGGQAVADAVVRLCRRIGAEVIAGGISTVADLDALSKHGVRLGQGTLLGGPARRPVERLGAPLPVTSAEPVPVAPSPATLAEFVRPALTVDEDATGEQIRALFRDSPELSGVVLVNGAGRPVGMVGRTRFLLAVSARFGFALHAERSVRDLADPPRVLPIDADPRDAVRMLGDAGGVHSDVAVVDSYGRCRGVARIGDLLQALAGLEHQRALALHPVTGLPGLPALLGMLESDRPRGIGLLVPDLLAATADGGFEAAVDGARRVARAVTDILPRFAGGAVAHGTGDDLVVLLDPADPPAFDAALRTTLAERSAPAVRTTWLRHIPGDPADVREIARSLARLRSRPTPLPRPAAG